MATEARDLIVLGSGPGGYVAAIRAAQLGRKVTIVEKEALGGVCLNWGCIPSKALLRSAQLYHDMHRANEFGMSVEKVSFDFPKIIQRSRDVAAKLSGGVQFLMKKNKIEVVLGTGKLERGNRLAVTLASGGAAAQPVTYTFKDIIIATGARPRPLPGVEVDGEVVHTYRTALDFRTLPKKILIVGSGAIGMEFAYFYSSFGAQVTVVEMLDQILPVEDTEIAQNLERLYTKKGLVIRTSATVSDVKRNGASVSAVIKTKQGDEKWEGDTCLVAIGVIPNTDKIGVEDAGITLDRGKFIEIDEFMRTNVPNHFAIGDVAGMPALAHVASHEGIIAAEAACGKAKHGMRYDNVPGCTYCQPQVASVGLTEKACKEAGIEYRVAKVPFSAIGKAIAIGEQDGVCKVIIDKEVGEVLGVHILHSEATELIGEATVIRSHEGIAASVVDTIHAHPTLSESIMEAMAAALGRPINT